LGRGADVIAGAGVEVDPNRVSGGFRRRLPRGERAADRQRQQQTIAKGQSHGHWTNRISHFRI